MGSSCWELKGVMAPLPASPSPYSLWPPCPHSHFWFSQTPLDPGPFGSLTALGGASLGALLPALEGASQRWPLLPPCLHPQARPVGVSHAHNCPLPRGCRTPRSSVMARWEPVGRRGGHCRLCHHVLFHLVGTKPSRWHVCGGAPLGKLVIGTGTYVGPGWLLLRRILTF